MSKSDKRLEKKVLDLKADLAKYESIEDPIFKTALTGLVSAMITAEMSKRSEKILRNR